MSYQLCSRDEYGQVSIMSSDKDIAATMKKIKQELYSTNVDNALTLDDKERNWEAYSVTIEPKDVNNKSVYIYAGKDGHGKDVAYVDNKITSVSDIKDVTIKIYLGELDSKSWFAKNTKRGLIDTLKDTTLESKRALYIKIV